VRTRTSRYLVALLVSILTIGAFFAVCGSAAARCRRYAATDGSNHSPGSAHAPFRTVQRLVNSLRGGQTGCVGPGVYRENVVFRNGGHRHAPITLRSAGRGRTEIVGRMWIARSANYVHVSHMVLDGRNSEVLPSPTVDSIGDSFSYDDVTNDHTGICFELGSSAGWGRAVATLITHNRIHDCGVLPPTNVNHGIYVGNSLGARIINNEIYDNADRGIQLYWNAQYTTVAGNIIDHNGEGVMIGGDGVTASSHNLIADNVITNSTVRSDIESWWPDGSSKGVGNLVIGNCVFGGHHTINRSAGGFVSRDNTVTNPHYANAAVRDYAIAPSSRCSMVLASASRAHVRYSGLLRAITTHAR
jgi:parallel beta-helix repeat protein